MLWPAWARRNIKAGPPPRLALRAAAVPLREGTIKPPCLQSPLNYIVNVMEVVRRHDVGGNGINHVAKRA